MQFPLKITFRGMDSSPSMEARVRERAARLERFRDRITSCEVVLEAPHQRHRQGNMFAVRLHITTPVGPVVVNQSNGIDHSHEDFYVAMRDAFEVAERQLDHAAHSSDPKHRRPEPGAD